MPRDNEASNSSTESSQNNEIPIDNCERPVFAIDNFEYDVVDEDHDDDDDDGDVDPIYDDIIVLNDPFVFRNINGREHFLLPRKYLPHVQEDVLRAILPEDLILNGDRNEFFLYLFGMSEPDLVIYMREEHRMRPYHADPLLPNSSESDEN